MAWCDYQFPGASLDGGAKAGKARLAEARAGCDIGDSRFVGKQIVLENNEAGAVEEPGAPQRFRGRAEMDAVARRAGKFGGLVGFRLQ
jgi:hypothetical protein